MKISKQELEKIKEEFDERKWNNKNDVERRASFEFMLGMMRNEFIKYKESTFDYTEFLLSLVALLLEHLVKEQNKVYIGNMKKELFVFLDAYKEESTIYNVDFNFIERFIKSYVLKEENE